ncbi:hypothetical protein [Bacillus sp. V5-8f]|nr:hypothetical protein [Bacillus sp. V5-8f]
MIVKIEDKRSASMEPKNCPTCGGKLVEDVRETIEFLPDGKYDD